LIIPGVSNDKISDITINALRGPLIEYTQRQCTLLGVPTRSVAAGPCWNDAIGDWTSGYYELPVGIEGSVILIPKGIARRRLSTNHKEYYHGFVLEYLQQEHLAAGSSLVRLLKNGKRVVYKKRLEERYPVSKEFLFEFSEKHPEVLEDYHRHAEKVD